VLDVVERCTDIETHVRHPYVGELVYTAFSGSHQDAINKGLAYQRAKSSAFWEVPYLPIDPEDVGRTYESIIRINSQSGKGGVAYILEEKFGYHIPKKMQPELGRIVQSVTDEEGRELSAEEIETIFIGNYFDCTGALELLDFSIHSKTTKDNSVKCTLSYKYNGEEFSDEGIGNGPIDACKHALMQHYPNSFSIASYSEHSCGEKSSAKAIAYMQIENDDLDTFFGVGADTDIAFASIKALFSALNRTFHS
jgi:2-isopropylmalate synthase